MEPEDILLEGDAALADPLSEAPTASIVMPQRRQTDGQVKTPKARGAIQESGRVRLAVMRPCVSRGKRLAGLPPIYTPEMLGRNAKVIEGWPMFVGHLAPELMRKIQSVGRSPADMGGRIVESWYDPELRLQEDEQYGYRPGAMVGEAIPYELAEKILERDPEGLHNSINAYPTSARSGTAPWDTGTRGMVVEGIRSTPVGSVDWVVRGGAGGRPYDPSKLSESERRVVSILESCYLPGAVEPDLQNMSADQLQEWMQEHRPELLPVLRESLTQAGGSGSGTGGGTGEALTESRVTEIVTTALQSSGAEQLSEDDIEERVQEGIQDAIEERETVRTRHDRAREMISEALREKTLTPKWGDELRRRYALLPSGPSPALLCEAEVENGIQTKTADEVLEARVKADIEHAVEMIREAQGGPTVSGQGGGGGDPTTGGRGSAGEDPLVEFLAEAGDDLGDEKSKRGETAVELLVEAAID
ncbi:MAG: hypothetical protein LC798_12760 [Chloroflexi bacterium]|nr:hypothetical protein [Chloroflexota bacterium]